MKMKSLLIISSMMFIFSCRALFDEKLTLPRRDYTGNELRTDGYYYYFTKNNTVVYFLYRNGIILCAHSYSTHDLNTVESEMIRLYPEVLKNKAGWGVFVVNGNEIEYDEWNAPTGSSLPIIKRKGYIENDTTFRITESYYSDIKKTDYKEFVYRFKQFDNKPDSTNRYIK